MSPSALKQRKGGYCDHRDIQVRTLREVCQLPLSCPLDALQWAARLPAVQTVPEVLPEGEGRERRRHRARTAGDDQIMSRTILTNVNGFTPIIDDVMKDTSLITAVVFGGLWRYCQMKNGVCQATLDKIADRVGLSRQAVIEHIKTLETAGYIEDITPNLRNRPHTYRDTGKAGLMWGCPV
jgi:hypothetical protein